MNREIYKARKNQQSAKDKSTSTKGHRLGKLARLIGARKKENIRFFYY